LRQFARTLDRRRLIRGITAKACVVQMPTRMIMDFVVFPFILLRPGIAAIGYYDLSVLTIIRGMAGEYVPDWFLARFSRVAAAFWRHEPQSNLNLQPSPRQRA
jgi:hypothetical protein